MGVRHAIILNKTFTLYKISLHGFSFC
jgi:hypothetical protein